MDVNYPLNYDNGGIRLVTETSVSRVRHFLQTIAGERTLYSDFGIDPTILFNTGVEEVFTERLRLKINQLTGQSSQVEVEENAGIVKIKVTIAKTTIEAEISN
jgi:hypothetical protein